MSLNNAFSRNTGTGGDKQPVNETQQFELYDAPTLARLIHFVQPSGIIYSFPYSTLMRGCFNPNTSAITLYFTGYYVTITGSNLNYLYHDVMEHMVKMVRAVDERYAQTIEENLEFVVNEIIVEERGK